MMCEEKKEGSALVVNAKISWGQMEQLGAVVVVCRLAMVNENTQGEEERGDWKGANGTAKPGLQ